jgi:tetratricopeptide (TPR) repeat protein
MKARRTASLTPVIGLLLLIGCGPDLEQMKNDAQHALSVGDFTQAREITSQALERVSPSEKRLVWALERIRLEALARDNEGEEARETLERLADEYPTQANASLYLAIATYLRDAGGTSGAIDVLIAGDERFPEESEKFKALIDEMEAVGLDPAEIERLKSLGYL